MRREERGKEKEKREKRKKFTTYKENLSGDGVREEQKKKGAPLISVHALVNKFVCLFD